MNPRKVSLHTISNRADSAALAPLQRPDRLASRSRLRWSQSRKGPGAGRGGRALRNGAPQTGSGPDGSSPQRTVPCAVGNLTVAPGTRRGRLGSLASLGGAGTLVAKTRRIRRATQPEHVAAPKEVLVGPRLGGNRAGRPPVDCARRSQKRSRAEEAQVARLGRGQQAQPGAIGSVGKRSCRIGEPSRPGCSRCGPPRAYH